MKKLALMAAFLLSGPGIFAQTVIAPGNSTNNTMFGQNYFVGPFNFYSDTGTANTYVIATGCGISNLMCPTPLVTLTAGMTFTFKALNSNSGASTLKVDSTSAVAIQLNGSALSSGVIVANHNYVVTYNGTQFDLVGSGTGGGGGGGVSITINGSSTLPSPVNFQNGPAFQGLTINALNPSLGNVDFQLTGTLADAGLANGYSGAGACAAHTWASTLTRNTAPTCTQPTLADIAAGVAAGVTGPYDFSAVTMKIPAAAAFTSSATSTLGIDTTATMLHVYLGADILMVPLHGSLTNGHCLTGFVSGSFQAVQDSGVVGCSGSGSGPTLQTNGSSNTSQVLLNFTNTTGAGEIDFTNPSGGLEEATVHNAAVTIAGTSVPLGGSTTSLPSPGAIGGGTPSTGAFTTASVTGQITSTLATGTAPFSVASTTPVTNLNIGGNAATASALASAPTTCSAGQASTGINATGTSQGCTNKIAAVNGGTNADSSAATGVAQVNAGAWSFSPTLANGTLATTQSLGDATVKVATDAFVLANAVTNPCSVLGSTLYQGASSLSCLLGPTATNGVPQIPISIPSGGLATAPIWAPAGVTPNPQTGTTYTIVATDRAKYLTFSNAASIAVTLPQAGTTGFANNIMFAACDIGAGTTTITPTTSTINYSSGTGYTSGASSMTLTTGQCANVFSDNTNYFAIRFQGGSGSPGGSNTQLQFNSSGSFGGASGLTTDGADLFVSGYVAQGTAFSTSTETIGDLAYFSADDTISNAINLGQFVGVITCTASPCNGYPSASGKVTVNLDATVTVARNDNICQSSSNPALGHDNGSTACTTNQKVGLVTRAAASVTSASVFLSFQ